MYINRLVYYPLDFNAPYDVRNTYRQQTLAFDRETVKAYYQFKFVLKVSFLVFRQFDASYTS